MTQPRVDVDGAREVRKALKQVEGGISDLKSVHADAAAAVEDTAHDLVPRRTGLLDRNIRSSGQASGGVVRAGGASVRYAGPIHFGWPGHGIEPQPFLYDAVDARADEVVAVYEKRVRELVRTHGLD